jgi:hypothetical protein
MKIVSENIMAENGVPNFFLTKKSIDVKISIKPEMHMPNMHKHIDKK